jgi:hypothetical protein
MRSVTPRLDSQDLSLVLANYLCMDPRERLRLPAGTARDPAWRTLVN